MNTCELLLTIYITLGRTRKLSGWVKRFIQPTKDANTENPALNTKPTKEESGVNKISSNETMVCPSSGKDEENLKTKVLWDETPKRVKIREADRERDDMETVDNVSITPLFSLCSSSVKSSTFSDSHSLQSTRATVVSGRTMETNSSTMAIPPASILDRARASSSTTSASTATSPSLTAPAHLHATGSLRSRPGSLRQPQLQRDNSSPTIDSLSTIK